MERVSGGGLGLTQDNPGRGSQGCRPSMAGGWVSPFLGHLPAEPRPASGTRSAVGTEDSVGKGRAAAFKSLQDV